MEVQDRIEKSLSYRECEQLQRDVAFGMAFWSDRSRIVGALGGTDNVQTGKPGDVTVCRRYPFLPISACTVYVFASAKGYVWWTI